jgi:hypothetical protein
MARTTVLGAGKTEACKLVMQYLLAAAKFQPSIRDRNGGTAGLTLSEVLARSDFVLEAFGNASTVPPPFIHNDTVYDVLQGGVAWCREITKTRLGS